MKITAQTIEGLDTFLKEHLEADVVEIIANRLKLPVEKAFEIYFNSRISGMIEEGKFGIQYLSPEYLAEEILKDINES